MDDLWLEQADHGLGEGIVVAVADAADGRLDPGVGEPLGVFDRDILHAPDAVVDQAGLGRAAHVDRLFARVGPHGTIWTATEEDKQMQDGRDKVPWNQDIWDRIDQAVRAECKRTKVAAKFLPMYGPIDPGATTVASDRVEDVQGAAFAAGPILNVDETVVTPIVEIQVQFQLTPQQMQDEENLKTAVTLAARAANHLSQAEDLLVFQGKDALENPLFKESRVQVRSGRTLQA